MLLKEGAFVATFIYALYFVTVSKCSTTNNQVLLVISLDGFRYDYFNRGLTPTLEILRRCGSYAPYMRPVFPTKTFVNHFSIATGLYAGTHGVLGNELYDAEQGHVIYSNDLFSQNKDVMPIWAWNEMRGGRSGCMMWPGSNFAYQGHKCTYTQPFDENISREDQLDKIISWILDPTVPANLIMMYVNQPDDASHAYGPYADKQNEMLRKVDNMFALLLKYLDDNNLGNRVNIIVLSDHGMSDVPVKHFIDLTQFLTPNTYKLDNTSPLMQIIPGPGYENEIFEKLSNAAENPKNHFKIYNNDTVPDRWRVRNKNRFGPILAVADPTYGFQDMVDLAKWFRDARDVPFTNESHYGNHGYDNDEKEMRAIFFGYGPIFNERQMIKPFNNVDLYNLFCRILNIDYYPNEGEDRLDIWTKALKGLSPSNRFKRPDRFCTIFKSFWKHFIDTSEDLD